MSLSPAPTSPALTRTPTLLDTCSPALPLTLARVTAASAELARATSRMDDAASPATTRTPSSSGSGLFVSTSRYESYERSSSTSPPVQRVRTSAAALHVTTSILVTISPFSGQRSTRMVDALCKRYGKVVFMSDAAPLNHRRDDGSLSKATYQVRYDRGISSSKAREALDRLVVDDQLREVSASSDATRYYLEASFMPVRRRPCALLCSALLSAHAPSCAAIEILVDTEPRTPAGSYASAKPLLSLWRGSERRAYGLR